MPVYPGTRTGYAIPELAESEAQAAIRELRSLSPEYMSPEYTGTDSSC